MKLMIVDDHVETRHLIREMIGHLATEIRECSNGEEAVRQCEEFGPDIVTMDLHIQPIDGIEAMQRILAAHPSTRVIVVTQSDSDSLRRTAIYAGASHFLTKDHLVGLLGFIQRLQIRMTQP